MYTTTSQRVQRNYAASMAARLSLASAATTSTSAPRYARSSQQRRQRRRHAGGRRAATARGVAAGAGAGSGHLRLRIVAADAPTQVLARRRNLAGLRQALTDGTVNVDTRNCKVSDCTQLQPSATRNRPQAHASTAWLLATTLGRHGGLAAWCPGPPAPRSRCGRQRPVVGQDSTALCLLLRWPVRRRPAQGQSQRHCPRL